MKIISKSYAKRLLAKNEAISQEKVVDSLNGKYWFRLYNKKTQENCEYEVTEKEFYKNHKGYLSWRSQDIYINKKDK